MGKKKYSSHWRTRITPCEKACKDIGLVRRVYYISADVQSPNNSFDDLVHIFADVFKRPFTYKIVLKNDAKHAPVEHAARRVPVLLKFDTSQGFWVLKLNESSTTYCIFNTPFGRYCFLRLPFGIISENFRYISQGNGAWNRRTGRCPDLCGWDNYLGLYNARTQGEQGAWASTQI